MNERMNVNLNLNEGMHEQTHTMFHKQFVLKSIAILIASANILEQPQPVTASCVATNRMHTPCHERSHKV